MPGMDLMKIKAVAVSSLLLWDCRDEPHLHELIDSWQYRSLLSDKEAAEVVELVAKMPTVV